MKRKPRWRPLSAGVLLLVLAGSTAWGQPPVEMVEQAERGAVNWSRGLIQAKGIAAPAAPNAKQPGDREADITGARRRAWQALFETAMQVRVQGKRTVSDIAKDSGVVAAKIEEMVKKARIVGQEYLSDGTVAVSVEMSLFGGFSQLVLPSEIKPIESLKTLGEGGPGPNSPRAVEKTAAATGLVVDARGIGALPALFPRIVDEAGQEIYGSAFVSREFAVQRGMSGYTMDAAAAQAEARVAPRPLTVKGLRTLTGDASAIVVSNADGARVRSGPEHLSYLKTCGVAIVLD